MEETGSVTVDRKNRKILHMIATSTTPICKKCKGELSSVSIVVGSRIRGDNDEDKNDTVTLSVASDRLDLFSCKNEKCNWYGLLTQLHDTKTETYKREWN